MANYSYVAVDPRGLEMRGTLDVPDQSEALRRIKEMGLFPTKVSEANGRRAPARPLPPKPGVARAPLAISIPWFSGRIKPAKLAIFTRQLATLVDAGMPLLRSLRTLQQQEENPTLRKIAGDLASTIENGSSFAEAVAAHPKVFNRLYVNMIKAGEIGGALETALRRLAEFMEKAQKIRGKVKAALFYPGAVLTIAFAVMTLLMVYVVPRFKQVFEGFGRPLPVFTQFVFKLSAAVQHHFLFIAIGLAAAAALFSLVLHTTWGRRSFDRFKLTMPLLGPLFRKVAISRFARTLGTLISNGVPILQALTIVKETAGNVAIGRLIATVHENVKQGDPIAPTLKGSRLFPAMVAGMVDVGEQTGALPDMLIKVADNYDDEVDNAASALTSLLEPIMIVFLAIVVGSIVVAMYLPLMGVVEGGLEPVGTGRGED